MSLSSSSDKQVHRRVNAIKRMNWKNANSNSKHHTRPKHLFNIRIYADSSLLQPQCDDSSSVSPPDYEINLTSSSNKGAAGRGAIAFWRKTKQQGNNEFRVVVTRYSESKIRAGNKLNVVVYKVIVQTLNAQITKHTKNGSQVNINYRARAQAKRLWQPGEKQILPPSKNKKNDIC